jgi:hypothetical protein
MGVARVSRYVYLGDRLTDATLIGQPCDPILRTDGKCIVGRKPRNQAVRFADGREVVVLARRLRLTPILKEATSPAAPSTDIRRANETAPAR